MTHGYFPCLGADLQNCESTLSRIKKVIFRQVITKGHFDSLELYIGDDNQSTQIKYRCYCLKNNAVQLDLILGRADLARILPVYFRLRDCSDIHRFLNGK